MSLILLFTFIQSLILIIRKRNTKILCCGLFCYSGDQPADPSKLKILALFNQLRGDHATGICVDDIIKKDTISAKEFLLKHNRVFDFDKYEMSNFNILGHCRQATQGYSKDNTTYAHPHSTKRNKKDFLRLVHNGSVTNCYDLGKKYDITTVDKSDSMLLALIITDIWDKKDLTVLREYQGSATVVFYTVENPNILYVHRDQLRELFYWQETPGRCYISSIKDSLIAIGADKQDVIEFEAGVLVQFRKGVIRRTWDLKDKVPYEIPKATTKTKSCINFTQAARNDEENKNKNRFYWEEHLIYYNGHVYTGGMYVNKATNDAVKKIDEAHKDLYDEYNIICGIPIKSPELYNKLYKKCSKDTIFHVEEFKKLLPSEIEPYALFPVLGKKYTSNNFKFFWHTDLDKLITTKQVYEWSPPLSNKIFSINRAGYLTGTVESKKIPSRKLTNDELIELLLLDGVAQSKSYTGLQLFNLFSDYKKQYDNVTPTFELFNKALVKYLENSTIVSPVSIAHLEALAKTADRVEDYEQGTKFIIHLNDILIDLQSFLRAKKPSKQSERTFHEEQSTFTDFIDDQTIHADKAYFKSQHFANNVLFSEYESFNDLRSNYVPEKKDEHMLKSFYVGVASIFKKLGLITGPMLDTIQNGTPSDSEATLSRIFKELNDKKYISRITDLLESSDITEAFAKLYSRFIDLNQKIGLTHPENLEYGVLEMGLKYVKDSSKNLDKKKLLSEYNINIDELSYNTKC